MNMAGCGQDFVYYRSNTIKLYANLLRLWKITTSKNIMVPLVNQFIILFGFGTVESMIGPHLKKNGATDFDVALLFLEVGTTSILGSIFFAQVCTNKIYAIIITINVRHSIA